LPRAVSTLAFIANAVSVSNPILAVALEVLALSGSHGGHGGCRTVDVFGKVAHLTFLVEHQAFAAVLLVDRLVHFFTAVEGVALSVDGVAALAVAGRYFWAFVVGGQVAIFCDGVEDETRGAGFREGTSILITLVEAGAVEWVGLATAFSAVAVDAGHGRRPEHLGGDQRARCAAELLLLHALRVLGLVAHAGGGVVVQVGRALLEVGLPRHTLDVRHAAPRVREEAVVVRAVELLARAVDTGRHCQEQRRPEQHGAVGRHLGW